jgi:hypothetical protein
VLLGARVAQGASARGAAHVGGLVARGAERAHLGASVDGGGGVVVAALVLALVVVSVAHHAILPVK